MVPALEALYKFRLRGLLSVAASVLFAGMLCISLVKDAVDYFFIPLLLFTGYFWIGMTSLGRHSYVLAKRAIGKEATVFEFLGTQLSFILFPLLYFRLKKEVEAFRANKK